MKGSIAAAVAGALLTFAGTTSAPAQDYQEYPTYERDGYPLTRLQLQVLGTEHAHERAAAPALSQDGMPATPHQLRVLRLLRQMRSEGH